MDGGGGGGGGAPPLKLKLATKTDTSRGLFEDVGRYAERFFLNRLGLRLLAFASAFLHVRCQLAPRASPERKAPNSEAVTSLGQHVSNFGRSNRRSESAGRASLGLQSHRARPGGCL